MEPIGRLAQSVALLMVAAVVPAIVLWVVFVIRRRRTLSTRAAMADAAIQVGLALSIALILYVGLRPGPGIPGGWVQWNLVPFRDLARAIDGRPWGLQAAIVGLVGNLLLFAPWGLFAALRFPRWTAVGFAALTLAIAVGVEVAQAILATGRSSDVTDIVVNTTGGLVGFAVGRALLRVWRRQPV